MGRVAMAPALDAREIIAERTRTIDQIKRLYAVVMGYAVTTCFSNIYACARNIGFDDTIGLSIILAQGITFVSLITLFFLGAERLLDTRYLQADSRVPSPSGLLFDLFSLGLTAAWFVVLANTFADASKGQLKDTDLQAELGAFITNLLILYGLDTFLLVCQLIRARGGPVSSRQDAIYAHVWWIVLNLVCGAALVWLIPLFAGRVIALGWRLDAVAVAVCALHVARFFADFMRTYRFYYPPWELPRSQQRVSQTAF